MYQLFLSVIRPWPRQFHWSQLLNELLFGKQHIRPTRRRVISSGPWRPSRQVLMILSGPRTEQDYPTQPRVAHCNIHKQIKRSELYFFIADSLIVY